MSDVGARGLFVDTGAFYARADESDAHHETAVGVFEAIRSETLPYRPLFTSQAVLAELATLLLYKLGHSYADRALDAILESDTFNVLPIDESTFEAATEQFRSYDDQSISFVDHSSAILAQRREVGHVFAFDGDFRTLGFTVVPADTNF